MSYNIWLTLDVSMHLLLQSPWQLRECSRIFYRQNIMEPSMTHLNKEIHSYSCQPSKQVWWVRDDVNNLCLHINWHHWLLRQCTSVRYAKTQSFNILCQLPELLQFCENWTVRWRQWIGAEKSGAATGDSIRLNQLPFSADMWQYGSQICFATFIQWKVTK